MKKQKDFSNEPAKEIKWQKEYCYTSDDFMVVPICPSCGEPAYEKDECVFCHQKFIWVDKPKEYEDNIAVIGDWVATQIYGSWSVYIEHQGKLIVHATFYDKLSKQELTNFLQRQIDAYNEWQSLTPEEKEQRLKAEKEISNSIIKKLKDKNK